jgi:15-cis-phytoene synthase
LQLANFWQDVSVDLDKGRIYIPLNLLGAHGLTEQDIVVRRFDTRYRALMKDLIGRTRELFRSGLPLVGSLDGRLRMDIELFTRGGMAILDAIETSGYNTLENRPVLTKRARLGLLGRAFASRFVASSAVGRCPEAKKDDNILVKSEAASPRSSPSLERSYAECNRIARAAHSSFYLAFYGLRKDKRNALCALYAFMRLVDNVADEPGNLESKRRGLARWRAMVDEADAQNPQSHAVLPALADTIARFQIPTRYFHDLVLGAEMDLTVTSYATFDRLSEYCYRVAGTVGMTCLHVFGFRNPRAPDFAERLGLAFQLTNIIRDVRADLEMGRVYLPEEDLERFEVKPQNLRGPRTAAIEKLLEFEATRAWRLYEEGAPLVDEVDPDSRATLWALVRTYSALLARIEQQRYDVFSSRISLSGTEKIQYLVAGIAGWRKTDALAKRAGDRWRTSGSGLRRRAG